MNSLLSGLTAVRYSGALMHIAIEQLEESNGLPEQHLLTRDTLVRRIRESGPCMTLHQCPNGTWVGMDKVRLIEVEGMEYIKWIDDGYACDDLGDLSENELG